MTCKKAIRLLIVLASARCFTTVEARVSRNNPFTANGDDGNGPYFALYGGGAWAASNEGATNVTVEAPLNTNRQECRDARERFTPSMAQIDSHCATAN